MGEVVRMLGDYGKGGGLYVTSYKILRSLPPPQSLYKNCMTQYKEPLNEFLLQNLVLFQYDITEDPKYEHQRKICTLNILIIEKYKL